jgi:hypothetical protein
MAMLINAPSIIGAMYQCSEMAQVVNQLRRLGKDKSLATLHAYLAAGGEDDKVLVICRLLFSNPKGWDPPVLGRCVPTINNGIAKYYPLFPIALSNGVPFLLIEGYELEGRGESATPCLKLCEKLSLVMEDYPLSGYEKAASALTESESFRNLYDKRDLPQMVKIVLRQAKATGQ